MNSTYRYCQVVAQNGHNGQYRSGFLGTIPYISHCYDVVKKLISAGVKDEITLSAAILHDYVEDVMVGNRYDRMCAFLSILGDIQGKVDIFSIVDELTFIPEEGISKEDYLKKVSQTKDIRVLQIKLADRICNVYDFTLSNNLTYAKKYAEKAQPLLEVNTQDEVCKELMYELEMAIKNLE